jgi:HEAT repeat protein
MTSKERFGLSSLLVFALAAPFLVISFCSALAQPNGESENQSMIRAAVRKLQHSKEVSVRLQAVVTIASHAEIVTSQTQSQLTESLVSDTDPLVRGAIATTFAQIAAKQAKGIEPGPNEERMVTALSKALSLEPDESVRRAIATAAARFNHNDAEKLLNAAQSDSSRSVQQAARQAKLLRDQRRMKLTTG